MQKLLFMLLLAIIPQAETEDELLFAHRVIECWRDHDIDLAKGQIQIFFERYPKSEFCDHFHAILGDIALEKLEYQNAITAYDTIQDLKLIRDIRKKRWHALYQLQSYPELYQEISPLLTFIEDEEELFYYAEAAFREALALSAIPEAADQQKSLFEDALPIFCKLQNNEKFSDHVLLATGEIYRQMGLFQEAADIYMKIAHEKKSHLTLYHAAVMLMQCNEDKACDLFAQITKGGGLKSQEAAYQWMMLLAKKKDWATLMQERRCFLSTLQEKHLPIYHFYSGLSQYDREQWEEAMSALQKSLNSGLKPPEDRSALIALIASAKECASTSGIDFAFQLIKERYPNDVEQAMLMRAITYRLAEKEQTAIEFLTELIAIGKQQPILEDAYLEKINLLMKQQLWESAHDLAIKFLDNFPSSQKQPELLRLLVNLSLSSLKDGLGYECLESDLKRALNAYNIYQPEEKFQKQVLLAKCHLKLENPSSAKLLIEQLLSTAPNSCDLHYLMSVALIKERGCFKTLVKHGEKVLQLDPDYKEADRVHVYLFNAYLEMSKDEPEKHFADKAADHLFQVIDVIPVSLENQLWLAHEYAEQKNHHPRAIKILEEILTSESNIERFQNEALILATLYEKQESFVKAERLLKILHELNPQPKVVYQLGSTLAHLGMYASAHDLFTSLEESSDPTIALPSRLQNARLSMLLNKDRALILKNLRDLWVKKTLVSEPIHLEAALDYADLCSSDNLLEILEEIKEHFVTQSDICSKDYHEQRVACPKQDHIYQAYMQYIDARIELAQVQKDQEVGIDSTSKKKRAMALLKDEKLATTKYLTEKAEERLK